MKYQISSSAYIYKVLVLLLLAIGLNSCGSYSNVIIPAQQEFILGEYQNSGFKAELKNMGSKTIDVKGIDKTSGEKTFGFGLAGKGKTNLSASRNEKVILANPHNRKQTVKVKLNRSVEGMRYQPGGEE